MKAKLNPELRKVMQQLIDEYGGSCIEEKHFFTLSIECAMGYVFQKVVYRRYPCYQVRTFYYNYIQRPINGTFCICGNRCYES